MNAEVPGASRRPQGLLMGLALGLVLVGGLGWAIWPKAPPRVQLSQALHDFGQIGPSDKVETLITVRNTGGRRLDILKVTTSCGCTKAAIEHEKLDPGQETVLKILFDAATHHSEEMKDPAKPEDVSHLVYLRSNDPDQPEVEIEIRAQLIAQKESQ